MAQKKADKSEFPVTLKHHGSGQERTVYTVADKVRAEFDGFTTGPKPKPFSEAAKARVADQVAASAAAAGQPQDSAGDAGKSTTTPSTK